MDLVCKRYGILPSEMIQRDPYWIDFDTAIALRGQLEQAKLEEEALEESKKSSSKSGKLGKKYGYEGETLKEKLKSRTIKTPEQIAQDNAKRGGSSSGMMSYG